MSAKPSHQLADPATLSEPLAEIRAGGDEYQHFFFDVCDQLETLASELAHRQQIWQTQQQEVEVGLERRAARLDDERTEVASQWERVQQLAEENRAEAATVTGENDQQVKQMFQEAERERAALQSALEVAQSQTTQLTGVVNELSEARTALVEVRQEISQYPEQLESARSEAGSSPDQAALDERVRRLEQERAELDQERAVLETELEAVRNRAADLAETMAGQRKQMAEERAQWTAELKRMRQILEALAEGQAAQPAATGNSSTPPPQAAIAPAEQAPGQDAADPVLDSVMAQFEMLQKDLARRRKGSPKTEKNAAV